MSWIWPRSPPAEERPSFQALLGHLAGECCHDPQTRPDFRRTPQRCTPLEHSLRLFLQRPRWKSLHRAVPSRRLWTTEPARPAKSGCCDPAAEDGVGSPTPHHWPRQGPRNPERVTLAVHCMDHRSQGRADRRPGRPLPPLLHVQVLQDAEALRIGRAVDQVLAPGVLAKQGIIGHLHVVQAIRSQGFRGRRRGIQGPAAHDSQSQQVGLELHEIGQPCFGHVLFGVM